MKQSKNYMYIFDLLLIFYWGLYGKYDSRIFHFKYDFLNYFMFLLTVLRLFAYLKNIKKVYYNILIYSNRKNIPIVKSILEGMLTIFLLTLISLVSYRPILEEILLHTIYIGYKRDTYMFPDNKKERFIVDSFVDANRVATEIVYEKDVFPGYICKKVIATYSEYLNAYINSEEQALYIQKKKPDVDYNVLYHYIKDSHDNSFCYQNLEQLKLKDLEHSEEMIEEILNPSS